MAVEHGTREGYRRGCRCSRCRAAQSAYQREYRARLASGELVPRSVAELQPSGPGPVEQGVRLEVGRLSAAESQPALVQVALALSRVLDGRIPTPKPAAAGRLVTVLDTLHKGSELRKPRLAMVRAMSEKGGPA